VLLCPQEEDDRDVQCVGAMDRVFRSTNAIGKTFPILKWGSEYSSEDFKGDINAGLTVGAMLVPQSMAYALLADLPPIYGLYSSIVPLVTYACLGTSRQLGVGPVAIVALMIASSFNGDMTVDQKVQQAMTMSFIVGLCMLIMGILRLGIVVNFISHSVMSAFTSAAGITIGCSQLKYLFGVEVKRYKVAAVFQTIYSILSDIGDWHGWTCLLGFTLFTVLLLMKQWKSAYPRDPNGNSIAWTVMAFFCDFSALFSAVIGTLWSYVYHKNGIEMVIVGDLPTGLSSPSFDCIPNFEDFESLFAVSLTIAIVGYLESIAVAQIMALKFKYKIDANQELLGIGMANFLGSLFSGFPVVGSFSRTAVNGNTGARTPLCGVISAMIVLLALSLITSLFYYLPLAALAAMIEVAVMNLIDFNEMYMAYVLDKRDFVVMIITFATTLGLGVKEGLFTGVLVSMALVVQHSAFPRIAILGKRTEKTNINQYRDIKRFDDAKEQPGILIVRLDAKLFFANAAKFGEFVAKAIAMRNANDDAILDETSLHSVLIDSRGINDVDLSGIHMLTEMASELERLGLSLVFCNCNDMVKKRMMLSHIKDSIPEAFMMVEDTQDAVDFINSDDFHDMVHALNEGADVLSVCPDPTVDSVTQHPEMSPARIKIDVVAPSPPPLNIDSSNVGNEIDDASLDAANIGDKKDA